MPEDKTPKRLNSYWSQIPNILFWAFSVEFLFRTLNTLLTFSWTFTFRNLGIVRFVSGFFDSENMISPLTTFFYIIYFPIILYFQSLMESPSAIIEISILIIYSMSQILFLVGLYKKSNWAWFWMVISVIATIVKDEALFNHHPLSFAGILIYILAAIYSLFKIKPFYK